MQRQNLQKVQHDEGQNEKEKNVYGTGCCGNRILEPGGIPGSSGSRHTGYLVCGTGSGSRLLKEQPSGTKAVTEKEFPDMAA